MEQQLTSIGFAENQIIAIKTKKTFEVGLVRTGDSSTDASVNILLKASDSYSPGGTQYDSQKWLCYWERGETGRKNVSIKMMPTREAVLYVDAEIVDFVRCEPGLNAHAVIAILEQGKNPAFKPKEIGKYIPLIGDDEQTEGWYDLKPMVGGSSEGSGSSGLVPTPPQGSQNKILTGAGVYVDFDFIQEIKGDGQKDRFHVQHLLNTTKPNVCLFNADKQNIIPDYEVVDSNNLVLIPGIILNAGVRFLVGVSR